MQAFWDWFIGEAGAAWIVGLLGIAAGLYAWLKRERPPKVTIQEIDKTRLLDLSPSEHEKLSVFYADSEGKPRRLRTLEQRQFAIYNGGSVDIQDPIQVVLKYDLEPPDETQQMPHEPLRNQWSFTGDTSTGHDQCTAISEVDPEDDTVALDRINLPYLNSYTAHEHCFVGRVVSSGESEFELLVGSGAGWSARLLTLDDLEQMHTRVLRIVRCLGWMLLLLACLLLLGPYLPGLLDYLAEDSSLWPYNLTEAMINMRAQAEEEDYRNLCAEYGDLCSDENIDNYVQEYRDDLEQLAEVGTIGRLMRVVGLKWPLSQGLGVLFYILALVFAVRAQQIAGFATYRLLSAQPAPKFT